MLARLYVCARRWVRRWKASRLLLHPICGRDSVCRFSLSRLLSLAMFLSFSLCLSNSVFDYACAYVHTNGYVNIIEYL